MRRFSRTDKFEMLMLGMTALCCSVALVSCGRTAKTRDLVNDQETAAQLKSKSLEDARQKQLQADALRAEQQKRDQEKAKAALIAQGGNPAPGAKPITGPTAVPSTPATVKPGTPPTTAPTIIVGGGGGSTSNSTTPPTTGGGQSGGTPADKTPATQPDAPVTGLVATNQTKTPAASTTPVARSGSSPATVGNETAALTAEGGIDQLTLTQHSAVWKGCKVAPPAEGANGQSASPTSIAELIVLQRLAEKDSVNIQWTSTRIGAAACQGQPLALGTKPATETRQGTLKIVKPKPVQGGNYTYEIELRWATPAAAPVQPPAGTTATPEPVMRNVMQIQKDASPDVLLFGTEVLAPQAFPTAVSNDPKFTISGSH